MSSDAPGPGPATAFGRRVSAAAIDGLLCAAVGAVVAILATVPLGLTGGARLFCYFFAIYAVALIYFAVMESSPWQASWGKRLMGLKVTDDEGNRIGFGRALVRQLGKTVSVLPLFLGFLMAAFTSRRQALHDLATASLVVAQVPEPAKAAAKASLPAVQAAAPVRAPVTPPLSPVAPARAPAAPPRPPVSPAPAARADVRPTPAPVRVVGGTPSFDLPLQPGAAPALGDETMVVGAEGRTIAIPLSAMAGAPQPLWALSVTHGPDTGRRFDVLADARVGRSADCEIRLTDESVSRNHASVSARPEGLVVTDAGSINGTLVGGVRISEPRLVCPGEAIGVGATRLVVERAHSRSDGES
jgi:uncharacterized RDD family membrane protein YckC